MPHALRLAMTLSALLAAGSPAAASPIGQPGPGPDYGFNWSTVSDPGNRPVSAAELVAWGQHPIEQSFTGGSVDHAYRIAQYETTTAQWFEFVQVVWPTVGSIPFERDRLTGGTIAFSGGQWLTHDPMKPASPHWTWAARYCNWLHNGKGTDPASWESGVYDASTFYVDDNGIPQHDLTRSPDARFFLPTLDEWKKAGHWDPEKNNGEGGYWLYPHGSDEPPIPGHPDDGGQTSAAYPYDPDLQKIGMYPTVQSPWGLFDMSGSVREFTEETSFAGIWLSNQTVGSSWGSAPWDDRFDGGVKSLLPHNSIFGSNLGFRIAGVVPTSGSVVVFVTGGLFAIRRRRSVRG